MGIRAEIEEDLAETLEDLDDFGMAVQLISPSGVTQIYSANDPLNLLAGQVLYDTLKQDAEGNTVVDHQPMVTLRITSLLTVPAHGENWFVKIPVSPLEGASLKTFTMERAPLDGRSIGYLRMIVRDVEQS